MGLTEHRYKDAREKLDKLGYRQPLGLESLLLVEHLLADLLHTTDNLKHHKNIAQQTIEKCDELECGVEPYRLENARLMQECNKLHQKLITERESAEKLEKELKTRVRSLENTKADLEFICAQHLNKIQQLNSELAEKGQKLLNLKGIKISGVNGVKKDKKNLPSVRSRNGDEKQRPFSGTTQVTSSSGFKSDSFCSNICNVSKNQYDLLLNEVKELKKERLEYIEDIASFKKQISTRNEEISRLQSLLEGGQHIITMNKECMCCEACSCKNPKSCSYESQLKEQLRECQDLQHEAMCRAVTLAERNKVLEAELKQRQCCQCVTSSNSTKGQIDKLTQLLHCRYRDVEKLKCDLAEVLKRNSDLEKDKASADHVLEGLVEERKQLNDRVNRLTIIERDLVAEIDRLNERSETQRLKLIELEQKISSYEQLSNEKVLGKRKDMFSSETFLPSDQNLVTSSEITNGDISVLNNNSNPDASLVVAENLPRIHSRFSFVEADYKIEGENNNFQTKKIAGSNGAPKDRSKGKIQKIPTSNDNAGSTGRVRSCPQRSDSLLKKSYLPVRSGDSRQKYKSDSNKGIKSRSKDLEKVSEEVIEEPVSDSSLDNLEERQATMSDTANQRKVGKRKNPLCNCEDHEHFDRELLVKLKESCEEELNNAKQNLLEERKRFELIIKDLTNKQMKLMEKLDEKQLFVKESSDAIMSFMNSANAGKPEPINDNTVPSAQHASQQRDTAKTDSGEPDWLKLERIQAECEYYYKEFSRLRDKIMSVSEDGSDVIASRGVQPVSLKLERLLTEREFFCREYHALQEQIAALSCDDVALSVVPSKSVVSVPVCTTTNIPVEVSELKNKLDEKDEEIFMLKQKLQDSTGLQQSGSVHLLELEISSLKNNIASLEEDKRLLKEKLKEVTESNVQEMTRLEKTVQSLTEKLQRSEFERRSLSNSINDSNHNSRILEDEINQYREEINKLRSDHAQQRSSLNNIKLLQDQTDRALSTSQDILSQTENELKSALDRLRESQVEKLSLEREISNLRNEHSLLRSSLTTLDQEKDSLLLKVDEKTERIVSHEKELKQRENRISHLEGLLADTQHKLSIAMDSKDKIERLSQNSIRDLERLKEELIALERSRDNAVRENKRLQDDLTSMTQECISTARALETARQEVEDLKMQLQGYVAEVQRVEEILQSKESERSQMLEQFQSLSAEATVLESSKNTLENEAKSTKNSLRAAEEKLSDLERTILDKDALVAGYEAQIGDLTSHIASLEMKLNKEMEERRNTELELANLKELCHKMESHKNTLSRHVEEIESDKAHLENEYHQIVRKHNDLEEKLVKERKNSASLENVLAETRQETLRKNMSCQELQKQIELLRDKVEELQHKLEHGNQALRRCQVEAGEYQQQVNDLRREVTHERFERVRAEEQTIGSYSPSISPS